MHLSEKIKTNTKTAHQGLEKIIVAKIKAIRSLKDYEQLLKMFYGFYEPVEKRMDVYIQSSLIPDYTFRRKSENIVRDLTALGYRGATGELLLCDNASFITDTATALGALYVMEGSTLGGPIIADMLIRYADVPVGSLSFFQSYGTENQAMWMRFVERLNQYGQTNDHQAVMEGAMQTFEQFKRWAKEEDL